MLLHSGQDFLTWKAILQKSALENDVGPDFLPNALRHAEDLDRYAYQPDKVVDSVADLDPVRLIQEFTSAVPPPRSVFNGLERRKPATSSLPG